MQKNQTAMSMWAFEQENTNTKFENPVEHAAAPPCMRLCGTIPIWVTYVEPRGLRKQ